MISRALEAEILRLHHTEHWPVGTIARQLRVHRERLGFGPEFGEHARPGAGHARRRRAASQPLEVRRHIGIPRCDHRLEVVAPLRRQNSKSRLCPQKKERSSLFLRSTPETSKKLSWRLNCRPTG